MTIKQQGGIFGRNPTFNDVDVEGNLIVDTNVLYVNSSTNRVGINNANPSAPLDVIGSPGVLAEFRDGTASNFIIETAGNVATIGNQAGASSLAFKASNQERMRVTNNGITFNGDTAAANALSDYEEGTWSPSYAPTSGSFTTMTYNNQEGYYTKIGDLVYINCLISTSNSNPSGGSGDLSISGLPFACGASEDHSLAISNAINWGGDYPLNGQVVQSSSTIKFKYRAAVNGTTISLDVTDMATSTSNNRNYIRFSGCYKV